MITIAIVYVCIFLFEWRYLQKRQRKPRTHRLVLGFVVLTFLCFEALYYFRDQFLLANVIEMVFDPIEKLIMWSVDKNDQH